MFCKKCGAEMDNEAQFCPKCGATVLGATAPIQQQQSSISTARTDDRSSGGFAFLCFLWPLLGLILYLVWKDNYPLKARSCGKGAIIGVILQVIGGILIAIIYVAVIGAAIGSYGSYGLFL